jgi:hypothetical protein
VPTTPCIAEARFDFHPQRSIHIRFDAPETSSDGGLLLLRQLDDRLGLCARLAAVVPDTRDPSRVQHDRLEQFRQRIFQIALGYEDQNDAQALRHDPMWKTACDRLAADHGGLSSQPSLSRFEHAVDARVVVRMQRELEDEYVASLPSDTSVVVLDIDSTDDPTHGQQPLAFFHGHYDQWMYFPLLVFDGEGRLVSARLRPGDAGNNKYATALVTRLVRKLKKRFPHGTIVLRADSGFCNSRLLDALDQLDREFGDVHYVLGLEKNTRLLAKDKVIVAMAMAKAKFEARTGTARCFDSFLYGARSWSRERLVIVKAEHLEGGPNPRFLVTTLDHLPASMVYEQGYCGRGDAENRIKDFKRALAGDRLSDTTYVANAFRLLLHVTAYRLLDTLRRKVAVVAPSLGRAQFDTLRLRLLKVAVRVRQTVRRIWMHLPQTFGLAAVFVAVAQAMGAEPAARPESDPRNAAVRV